MGRRARGGAARWPRVGIVVGVLVASIVAPGSATAEPGGVDPDGLWGPVEAWPLVAIHAVLMPDGTVGGFFGLGVVLIVDDDPAPGAGP